MKAVFNNGIFDILLEKVMHLNGLFSSFSMEGMNFIFRYALDKDEVMFPQLNPEISMKDRKNIVALVFDIVPSLLIPYITQTEFRRKGRNCTMTTVEDRNFEIIKNKLE